MSRRSPWVLLSVLSLVGSLLAVSAAPAAAEDGEADNPAIYSACVGQATESAGFDDVPTGSVSEKAINCMAHYGIMLSTSAGEFSPRVGVTRQQMALFLIRAAGPAGIEIPRTVDQGFKDIGDLPRHVRDAINQLVELEITRGTTRSSFTPDTVVTRRQMAQFLARFLEIAPVGEGGYDINDVDPDDDHLRDLDDLPHDPYDAIRALFELGVTTGKTRTTFAPQDPVTRAQMALFISRMLAHTNARPAGVTLQAEVTSVTAEDTVDLVVSVRDVDHQPVDDASVDLFYAAAGDDAFDSGGKCSNKVMIEFGDERCIIDFSDETTDGDGNLPYTMIVDESLVLYAWTGDRGGRFDEDDTDYASLEFSAAKGAVAFLLTDDMHAKARKIRFGRSVEFTFQLVDVDDNPVAQEDVEIRIRSREENDRRVIRDHTRTYETDSSGTVELRFRLSDPHSREDDVDGLLDLTVLRSDVTVIDKSAVDILDGRLQWSDDDDEENVLILEQSIGFHQATDSGSGGRNRVTATLVDQYGDPIRRVRVHFVSNDPDGLGHKEGDTSSAKNAYRKTTSSRGVATVTYYRDSDDPGTETIEAFTDGDATIDSEPLLHHWVDDPPDDETISGEVVHHDDDRSTIVLKPNTGGPYLISYDPNDQFNDTKDVCAVELDQDGDCPGNNYDRVVKAETYTEFREGIDEGDELTVVLESSDRATVNSFTRS